MSQEKVDQHKAEKKNRKKLNKKARIRHIISAVAGALICLALVGWIGFSVYTKVSPDTTASESDGSEAEVSGTPIDIDPISDYIGSLNPEE
ncbi:MAG: hypothetical protein J6N76_07895 [Lachnospiraceae bacterium]|nr:hypothetical protein [Lachnospiraceae bacterium]